MPPPVRHLPLVALAVIGMVGAARAADPQRPPTPRAAMPGRFLATCEDLGQLCFADGCGRDQIAADLACRAQCPSAVTLSIVRAACPLGAPVRGEPLRRKG